MVWSLRSIAYLCAASPLIFAVPATANGFENRDVSVVAAGQAGAGVSAGTDIAAAARNPAIIGQADGWAVAVGGFYRFSSREATSSIGGIEADAEDDFLVGSGTVAFGLSDRLAVGVSAYHSLRLNTQYPANFPSAGDIIYDRLKGFTIQPEVAVSLDNLHLGAGIGFTKIDAELAQATLTGPGTLAGDDWAHHFTVGLVYEFGAGGSLGLSYRSKTEFDIDSQFSPGFTVPSPTGPLNIGGGAVVSGDFPQSVSAGFIIPVGERLKLAGEVQWTDWSGFENVAIQTAGGATLPLMNTTQDGWLFALGGEYAARFGALRAGIAYDKSTVREPPGNVRFPYGDSIVASIGASFSIGATAFVDLAYAHEFMDESRALVVNGAPGSSVSFEGGRDTVSLGFRFGM